MGGRPGLRRRALAFADPLTDDTAALAPQMDTWVLVSFRAAKKYLNFDGHPPELYVRTQNSQAHPGATT
jgi:hypothetical protein